MLGAQPKELEYHWMMLHGASSRVRSVDAVVLPKDDVYPEHWEGLSRVVCQSEQRYYLPRWIWEMTGELLPEKGSRIGGAVGA